MESIELQITGMTCMNCQNRIEAALRNTEGILRADVSYVSGTAKVTYDEARISRAAVEAVIEGEGYEIRREDTGLRNLIRVISLFLAILLLYLVLSRFGILNLLVPSQLADSGMGYGMLIVTGILTSVHCVAMCGGINLSQSLRQCADNPPGRAAVLRPSLLYNLGRVLSYTLIGGILGTVGMLLGLGSDIGISNLLQGGIKLAAGVLMVLLGVNMLNLAPPLRKLTWHPPKQLGALGKGKRSHSGALFVGLLNGLMPCGPLQSMQLVALASGSPVRGALSMLCFSLGTVPLMLGLGSLVSALGTRFAKPVMTAGAVLVTVMGLSMLSQGGSLSGLLSERTLLILLLAFGVFCILLNLPIEGWTVRNTAEVLGICVLLLLAVRSGSSSTASGSTDSGSADTVVSVEDGVQIVESTLQSGQYPVIEVEAGIPVKWIITAPEGSINGCNYKLYINDYEIEFTFSEGENIITFTPEESGTVTYSCWMGMITGRIIVT